MLREWFSGERELLSTFDGGLAYRVAGALEKGGVRFRMKATDTGRRRRGSLLGPLGEDPARQIQYQVFVKKADLERAQALSRQGWQT